MSRVNGTPDAVVVGAGPNGLAAALRLAAAGVSVRVVERGDRPGGGMRTEEHIRPGDWHDIGSTVHPMAAAAPFFREFDLASRGVRLVHPEISFAHPLDGGRAALSFPSFERTAEGLGADAAGYRRLFGPLLRQADQITEFFLTSAFRRVPVRGFTGITRFGLQGLPNVSWLAHRA